MEVTEGLPDMRYIRNIERDTVGLSEEEKEKIKEKILKISVPESLERQNLNLGYKLYGELDRFLELERLTKEQKLLIDNLISNIQKNPSKKKIYLRLFLDRFPDLSNQDKKDIIQSNGMAKLTMMIIFHFLTSSILQNHPTISQWHLKSKFVRP